jgi:hypothetical protein
MEIDERRPITSVTVKASSAKAEIRKSCGIDSRAHGEIVIVNCEHPRIELRGHFDGETSCK